MKQNVWIWNHYATNTYFDKAGRHYWFAKNLTENGYKPTIFCASTVHNSDTNIDVGKENYVLDYIDDIPYVFVKTTPYKGNGKSRILNMVSFYRNIMSVAKEFSKLNGKPDVILASSVHPLTLVAGIKIAKKFGVPCICEIRDLWPESIVEFGNLKKNSILARMLYQGEKWIYKNADRLIFTMEGGKDYITHNKWDNLHGGPVDLSKVYHINNGVDLIAYERNIKEHSYEDKDLDNPDIFKVIYSGSIRKANNLSLVIHAAKYVKENEHDNIKFIIFGDGDEKKNLEQECKNKDIDNVIFKGKVDKKYIPNILSKSNLNLLNYSNHEIWKYGGSQNKNFEYLASGKPILSTITMGYDIIKKYNAGISMEDQNFKSIGDAIINISQIKSEKYEELSLNAKKAANLYDFKILSEKLIEIIETP